MWAPTVLSLPPGFRFLEVAKARAAGMVAAGQLPRQRLYPVAEEGMTMTEPRSHLRRCLRRETGVEGMMAAHQRRLLRPHLAAGRNNF